MPDSTTAKYLQIFLLLRYRKFGAWQNRKLANVCRSLTSGIAASLQTDRESIGFLNA